MVPFSFKGFSQREQPHVHTCEDMAKIRIKSEEIDAVAEQLKASGITVDRHRLPDGTYRVYVRKANMVKIINERNEYEKENIN